MGRHVLDIVPTLVLELIVAEPGENTAKELGQALGMPPKRVRKHLHSLARTGLVAPRAYRLTQAAKLGPADSEMAGRIFGALVESAPLSRAELLRALGLETCTKNFSAAVKYSEFFGWLITPGQPVPTQDGIDLVLERHPELGEGWSGLGGWKSRPVWRAAS
jgi:hypothetical protein